MDQNEAAKALNLIDWDTLLNAADGTKFPAVVDGELVWAEKVHSVDKADADYERELLVVVKLGDQYFKQTGWANVGSHCYGEYTPSWNGVKEAFPKVKTITVWE